MFTRTHPEGSSPTDCRSRIQLERLAYLARYVAVLAAIGIQLYQTRSTNLVCLDPANNCGWVKTMRPGPIHLHEALDARHEFPFQAVIASLQDLRVRCEDLGCSLRPIESEADLESGAINTPQPATAQWLPAEHPEFTTGSVADMLDLSQMQPRSGLLGDQADETDEIGRCQRP